MLLPGGKAARAIGVHPDTLRLLGDAGQIPCIRLPSGQRRYDVSAFKPDRQRQGSPEHDAHRRICYCRVSRNHQREDLKRQVAYMRERFPSHDIITDIGSGINFKRQGLQTILRYAMLGQVEEVVVAYRDRLARIAADLVEWILAQNGAKLVVLHQTVDSLEGDLAEDLMAIVNVFCCRANGKRKYTQTVEKTCAQKAAANAFEKGASVSLPRGPHEAETVDGVP